MATISTHEANMNLETLKIELARINAQIESAKRADKLMQKIKNTKLHARTAHKYYDLQALYVETTKANLL